MQLAGPLKSLYWEYLPVRASCMGVQIKDLGAKAGVVLNPGTSLTAIEEVRILPLLTASDEGYTLSRKLSGHALQHLIAYTRSDTLGMSSMRIYGTTKLC